MEDKSRILILGGTGAMGAYLVQLLSKRASELYVTTRSERLSTGKIHYLEGNAHNLEFLQPILQRGWDVIVDFMVYSTDELRNRIDLLLSATTHYIYLSSARVYGDSHESIVEDSPRLLDTCPDDSYLETEEYALTKARQEDILHRSGRKNWSIVRPYITYSGSRMQLGVLEKEEWLYRALHGRTIVFPRDMMSKTTTLTHGMDVAKGIVSILGKEKALCETFHITTNQSLSWLEVWSIYSVVLERYLGTKPKIVLCELEKFRQLHPLKAHQITYDRLYNRSFSNDKIGEYLDVDSFVEPSKGLEECMNAFLRNVDFKYINWRAEALSDRKTREFAALTEMKKLRQKFKYCYYRFAFRK